MAKSPKKAKSTTATNPVTVTLKGSHSDYYKQAYLNNWLADQCGPAPTLTMFDVVHAIDPKKRPGHEALHIAMALRPQGCTVRQFQVAGSCGPANNYRRALITVDKVIKVDVLPVNGTRAYAFKAVLTAKGVAMAKAAGVKLPAVLEGKASEAKAKSPRKPRAAKATANEAAPTPASEAPQAAPQA